MKRPLVAVLLAVAATILCLPASAMSKRWTGWNHYETHYLGVYEKCWRAFRGECGRNIVDDRLANGRKPSRNRVIASSARMTRWLAPPKPEPAAVVDSGSVPTPPPAPSVPPAPVATGGGCPSSMAPESGTAGYGAYNSSSGAQGCYQILPSTAAAHGCDLSTPGGQDMCAQRICATEGPGAWAASGASPC